MSSVHLARQGFITKATLPSVSRERGTTTAADNRTVLLLNGNGTNGAQNNTFVDASTNNFSITRNGNTTQGSYSPFTLPDGQWSNFFDGSGDFLSFTGVNSAFGFGTGDFTVECWVNPSATPADAYIWDFRPATNNGAWASLDMQSSKFVYVANAAVRITGTTVPVVGRWYHVAISRSGTSTRMFVNGVQEGSTYTDSTNYVVGSGRPYIGTDSFSNTLPFTGYISNFRILKGTAAYTTTFTPPTVNLTAITNTSLLTCQSNRFRDNSSNNFAITRNGDVRVTPWSPFAPTSAYDSATNGGSGYFDGTGDYLSVPHSTSFDPEASDFTVECWFNITGNSALNGASQRAATLVSKRNITGNSTGWDLSLNGNSTTTGTGITFQFTQATNSFLSIVYTATIPQNCWNHVAVTRSGSSFTIYLNGVSVQTATITQAVQTNTQDLIVGGTLIGSYEQRFIGYISNLRMVKGSAVAPTSGGYTAPVTNITNTSLLLNFTNAGIFDAAGDNVIETVGNAQIDTAIKKYGTGALEFDGSGDSIVSPSNPMFAVGTGDFTIEFWGRWNAVGGSSPGNLFTCVNSGTLGVWVNDTSVQLARAGQGGDLSATVTQTTGVWNHYAITRQSGTARIFKDGVLLATGTVTTNYGQNGIALGGSLGSSTNGYVDDFRFTLGQARYTATFTPPTSELAIVGTTANIVNNSTYGVYQLA